MMVKVQPIFFHPLTMVKIGGQGQSRQSGSLGRSRPEGPVNFFPSPHHGKDGVNGGLGAVLPTGSCPSFFHPLTMVKMGIMTVHPSQAISGGLTRPFLKNG